MNLYIIPPGETLKELMSMCNIEISTVASTLGLTIEEVNLLLAGQLPLTENIASNSEKLFNASKDFWLNLEANYRKELNAIL